MIKVIRAAWTREGGGGGAAELRKKRKNYSALETDKLRKVVVNYEACLMKCLGRVDGSSG